VEKVHEVVIMTDSGWVGTGH